MSRYPKNVISALNHIWVGKENIAKDTGDDVANEARVLVGIKKLVDEVIFRESGQWDSRNIVKQLNIQELELLTVCLDYFANLGENNQLKCNTLFMTLFPPVQSDRLRLLSKLVCMAIFTKNVSVLNAAGIWMQELGCTSEFSAKLADDIYLDLFLLVPKPLECLKDLPTLSPHFTANLVTTFAERFVMDVDEKIDSPPADLLAVITLWISNNRTLCMAALAINIPLLLPRGISTRPATSPFGGLVRWCVLAPLYLAKIYDVSTDGQDLTSKDSEMKMDFSKLHLALVQSAEECNSHKHAISIRDVVSVQQLCKIVESICLWVHIIFEQVDAGLVAARRRGTKALSRALDQFAQVVHLLLAANIVSGNIEELVNKIKLLPPNTFLHIILDRVHNYAVPLHSV